MDFFLTFKKGVSLEQNALNTETMAYTMYTYVFCKSQFIIIKFGPKIYSIQIQNFLILLSEAGRIKDFF